MANVNDYVSQVSTILIEEKSVPVMQARLEQLVSDAFDAGKDATISRLIEAGGLGGHK